MSDSHHKPDDLAGDMAEYLQTFLDETEEQLDDLVETMLALERQSSSQNELNEAFRLIHSIKGSAGMMGFDNITVLTHHLESHFERLRSGLAQLDERTMGLVLRCVDFLRQCNSRLRDGEQLRSATELLEELKHLDQQTNESQREDAEPVADHTRHPSVAADDAPGTAPLAQLEAEDDSSVRMSIRFRAGLQLADLKARLIVTRLSGLGEVKSTRPDLDRLEDPEAIDEFEVRIQTDESLDELRAAADVDGVEAIEFVGSSTTQALQRPAQERRPDEGSLEETATPHIENDTAEESTADPPQTVTSNASTDSTEIETPPPKQAAAPVQAGVTAESDLPGKAVTKVAETMRVDIDRLDNLMNLAGELVVNRARFVQISSQISPALRKASMLTRVRDFSDSLQRTIESLENADEPDRNWSEQILQLRAGLELMQEQSDIWENGRYCVTQITEAIDQLSRVSHSLQRGVLDTRMVPVGPLFNRFQRVVRDLSKERGKQVNLVIHGEKTELDKRMIDDLGDPLVHLVRNSIDHGLESPDARANCGKDEIGTISLEASHSGNNVYIHVRDDGGGIDVDRIKAKLLDMQILDQSEVDDLSDEQALQYIWHPGFSTATEVTDVSGRGVGMDAVKSRIGRLNGTVEVDSTPQHGTTFTIRLPLTLAIINCLLVRMRGTLFSVPIDTVREIVSVEQREIVTVRAKRTFEVRGEFIPLIGIDDIFEWGDIDQHASADQESIKKNSDGRVIDVVILHTGGKSMGLSVDELLGSQDIVIKSLSDNFIDIRGLSGASILGDGSVCLMLDVGSVIGMTTRSLVRESH